MLKLKTMITDVLVTTTDDMVLQIARAVIAGLSCLLSTPLYVPSDYVAYPPPPCRDNSVLCLSRHVPFRTGAIINEWLFSFVP